MDFRKYLLDLNPLKRPKEPIKNPGRELARLALAMFIAWGFSKLMTIVLTQHAPSVLLSIAEVAFAAGATYCIWVLTRNEKTKKVKA